MPAVATALIFLCSSRFGASFINGFSISEATKLSIGQLDTVFAYLMLAFAFLEVLLLKRVSKWNSTDLWVLTGILGLGLLNLIWKMAFATGFTANSFLYVAVVLLFIALHPTRKDLKFLPYFGASVIFLVSVVALLKYQNPLFPYTGVDFGLGSPYQNRVWDFFGLEERFRGPYFHPNQLGIQITFLSMLALFKSSKFYLAFLPVSFTLLFLASSRTSIIALLSGLLLKLYFDATQNRVSSLAGIDRSMSKQPWYSKLDPKKFIFAGVSIFSLIMVVRQIVGTNTTGTGRLQNYVITLTAIRENLLLGRGPSLFSIHSAENTILTVLSFYGLVGFSLLLVLVFSLTIKIRKIVRRDRSLVYVCLGIFGVASSGEALLYGSSSDIGLYYLLILLTLTRHEDSDQKIT